MESKEFIVVVCVFLIAFVSLYIPMFIGLPILVSCIFFLILYYTIIQKNSEPKESISVVSTMNRNEFIKELEKLGFKEDPTGNFYTRGSGKIFLDEYKIRGVNFGTIDWSNMPTDFEGMLNYLKSLNKKK